MIYADYAATTPVDPEVLDAMMPFFAQSFGNASSTHAAGLAAQQAVLQARSSIAADIGARLTEIVFTSGATEAINLAMIGCARRHSSAERKGIVAVRTEHPAVIDAANYLEAQGFPVTWLGVDANGVVDPEELRSAVTPLTLMVSVMAVNNETGVRQDLKALSSITRDGGAFFMTDATQAWGKVPLNVDEMGIDFMSFSGHKLYGPKGIGALFVRRRKERSCDVDPLLYGGGQEGGMRSGTLNVPGIVGLAAAGSRAHQRMSEDSQHIESLRDMLESRLVSAVDAKVNGSAANRSSTISNITFPFGTDIDMMLLHLPHVAISKGSACSSSKPRPSHVLTSMGRDANEVARSVRISFGRFSTMQECRQLANDIVAAHEKARLGVLPTSIST